MCKPMWYVHPNHRRSMRELAVAEADRRNDLMKEQEPRSLHYWYVVTDPDHYPGEWIITIGRYAA